MTPYREVFWNISNHLLFYVLAAIGTAVCLYGLYRRYRFWSAGWRDKRPGGFDLGLVVRRVLLNASILSGDPLGGVTHLAIMWGFCLLFVGTAMSTIDHWIISYLRGNLYLGYAFVLDIAGIALLAGVVLAYLRRYVWKRDRMVTVTRDHVVLALLLFIGVTGFLVEGMRLRAQILSWREPSPVGLWIASISGLDEAGARSAHAVWWWLHALASVALIGYFPFSKFIHVFAAPVNVAFEGMRTSTFLSLEEREKLGQKWSFRQLLSMDACTQCNRCTVVCPSAIAGEPLAPRAAVDEAGRAARRAFGFRFLPGAPTGEAPAKALAIAGEEAWYCTTCAHCQKECPVAVSPMDLIHEVRAARLESGERVPENLQGMLESVYKFKNPWEGAKGKRMEWAAGLDVPMLSEGAASKRCFYVGCTFAYDARLQAVPRAAVALFAAARYPFAVLGKDEVCCSEIVRGAGEEGLFHELAGQTADAFERHGIEEIVTPCPHGFHAFSNEYRFLNAAMANRRVRHVSQALEELIRSGALRLEGRGETTVTYHDPCFLGRRNGVYDAPRAVLRAIPGVRLVEMERIRERSLCCGGGGGRMWVEASAGEKMGEVRAREAAATGAQIVVTACPFCFTNLDDGVKTAGYEGKIVVKDLTELVAEHLAPGPVA